MSSRVLRFKANIPFHLESKLCQRYGYAVLERDNAKGYVTFSYNPKPISNIILLNERPILATRQSELLRRCDNIVEFFPDPYNSQRAVRTRLHNMSQTLSSIEKQFVLDYMEDNFPVSEKIA